MKKDQSAESALEGPVEIQSKSQQLFENLLKRSYPMAQDQPLPEKDGLEKPKNAYFSYIDEWLEKHQNEW